MLITRVARHALAIIVAASLSACVTLPPNSPRSPQDPWESWNRGVYKFNDAIDRGIAKPVARAYVRVVPKPIRTGISNFFANLNTPDGDDQRRAAGQIHGRPPTISGGSCSIRRSE